MNEEEVAALALLSRMRFACGDNGLRMQDELEEYLRELKRNADRYTRLRHKLTCGSFTAAEELAVLAAKSVGEIDAAVDAMKGANT